MQQEYVMSAMSATEDRISPLSTYTCKCTYGQIQPSFFVLSFEISTIL